MKIDWKKLIGAIALPVGIGLIAGALTRGSMAVYDPLNKPPFAPPGWLFPVVWTILYVLMGISSYLIVQSDANEKQKDKALSIYGFQLFFNFLWPIIFFNLGNPLVAFIVLVVLWVLIILMIREFAKINKTAAWLQVPYLIWVTFAGYLNLAIYLLNR